MQQEIINSLTLSQTKDTLLISTHQNLKSQNIESKQTTIIQESPSMQSCFFENFIISLNNEMITILALENRYVTKLEIKKNIINKNFNAFSNQGFVSYVACEDEIIKITVNQDFSYKHETYYKFDSEIITLKVCKDIVAVAFDESLVFMKDKKIVQTYEINVRDIDCFCIGDMVLFAGIGDKTYLFENLKLKNEFEFVGDCVRFSQSGMCFCVSNNDTIKAFGIKSDGSFGEIEMEKLE